MVEQKISDAQVKAMVLSGMTSAQIAEEVGVAQTTVRRRARALGLMAKREVARSITERARDMTPGRAVEYLCDALEMMHAAFCGVEDHEIDAWPVRFTPAERRMLIVLLERPGALVSTDQLISAVAFGQTGDETCNQDSVRVMLCKLRAKLPAECGQIVNVWGRGYRFVRPETA